MSSVACLCTGASRLPFTLTAAAWTTKAPGNMNIYIYIHFLYVFILSFIYLDAFLSLVFSMLVFMPHEQKFCVASVNHRVTILENDSSDPLSHAPKD